ncbi:MAG: hypothetical protein A2896_01825 [Candidatus Nealsonbacteria bacterium RIFCSPLOWO2_01_FULL_43_32]|uniref:UDP-N-acetyl-alpha-D-muramoyl-L-alanyl-L-glutamate epimerase n=1 Tax=Candidatus Nealsonbacteria bacterium RIFCSPLOWO2_01_FULL_43_32 TaxID=1801672 RepID=A0A1G2EFU6_9BACT|nr:MAG: hypothetical protein A2896_01825 [Candidatus Nealsonbacteria bacterium RIFCSPLOWO2_01_FULL_43_32]
MKAETLRKKYPRFVYQKYSYRVKRGGLRVYFHFKIEPNIVFRPRITIKNIPEGRLEKIGKRALDNFVFHLGLMEIPSYWKATCSPEIAVQAGYLDKNQVGWWHELIIKGMGQYFYENRIDWRDRNFLKISINPGIAAPALAISDLELKDDSLIPIGGGKDSIVTLNLLKKQDGRINCFLLNPSKAQKRVAKIAGIKSPIIVERSIDAKLLDLNEQGYLNGHTPLTAVLSFLAAFCAVLFDYKNIAFSNEKSANEGNVSYLGKTVNHQWAKTSEFEKMFKAYCQKYLAKNINYFSFLRKYTELQIAQIFAKYPKYFATFSSCNRGIKIGERWCNRCPKCLFTYLVLYPFLAERDLHQIFGQDLFENKKLLPVMKNLIGEGRHKPFECVGTYRESRLALRLALKKAKRVGKIPYILQKFNDDIE